MPGEIDTLAARFWSSAPSSGFVIPVSTSLYSQVIDQGRTGVMVTYNTGNTSLIIEGSRRLYAIPGVEQLYYMRDENGVIFFALCNNISDDNLDLLVEEGVKLGRAFPSDHVIVDVSDRYGREQLHSTYLESYTFVYPTITIPTGA